MHQHSQQEPEWQKWHSSEGNRSSAELRGAGAVVRSRGRAAADVPGAFRCFTSRRAASPLASTVLQDALLQGFNNKVPKVVVASLDVLIQAIRWDWISMQLRASSIQT
jgi:hypothetical protein